ncbi:MAG: hypothetical protein PHT07_24945 [Paludibacter sp.]|nr:hypothetical protein [Paludibacter sp.]
MSESSALKSILDYLTLMRNQGKCWYVRVGSGKIRTANGGFFHTGGVGCPDLIVLTRRGFIALEVKAEKGKLSEGQVGVKNEIELLGGSYHVVRSVDDVIAVFNSKGWHDE